MGKKTYIRRARGGDPIRADEYNKLVEVANDLPDIIGAQRGIVRAADGVIVQAQNESGIDAEPYQVMSLSSQIFDDPRDHRETVLELDDFGDSDEYARACVVMDYIPDGEIGRVCVSGIAIALANGTSGSYATPSLSSRSLTVGSSGIIQAIWFDGDEGIAIVRIGGGGSTGGNPNWSFVWNEGA